MVMGHCLYGGILVKACPVVLVPWWNKHLSLPIMKPHCKFSFVWIIKLPQLRWCRRVCALCVCVCCCLLSVKMALLACSAEGEKEWICLYWRFYSLSRADYALRCSVEARCVYACVELDLCVNCKRFSNIRIIVKRAQGYWWWNPFFFITVRCVCEEIRYWGQLRCVYVCVVCMCVAAVALSSCFCATLVQIDVIGCCLKMWPTQPQPLCL